MKTVAVDGAFLLRANSVDVIFSVALTLVSSVTEPRRNVSRINPLHEYVCMPTLSVTRQKIPVTDPAFMSQGVRPRFPIFLTKRTGTACPSWLQGFREDDDLLDRWQWAVCFKCPMFLFFKVLCRDFARQWMMSFAGSTAEPVPTFSPIHSAPKWMFQLLSLVLQDAMGASCVPRDTCRSVRGRSDLRIHGHEAGTVAAASRRERLLCCAQADGQKVECAASAGTEVLVLQEWQRIGLTTSKCKDAESDGKQERNIQ